MKNVFLVSGPSGSGKGSIIESLSKHLPLERVITTTTRPVRPGESDGHPYHFIDHATFMALKDAGAFVEYAQTYNNEWYGVQKADLEKAFLSDRVVIWEVEFKGVQHIKNLYPEIKCFYINVPEEIFRQRLIKRDNPSPEYLESRVQYIHEWAQKKELYDYIIENKEGQLEKAVDEIRTIITKELAK